MNSKKKGNAGEWAFAHWLTAKGLGNAYRNAMSGGTVWKGDIANSLDLTIEVKTVKKLNLLDAWQQVARDSSKARNSPLLAIRYDHMPKDEWLMVMHSEDWAELMKRGRV